MKFIKILPEGLIDRIAAGEVIENPASVVKELVENALDASSTNIEISTRNGGKDEIIIVDDGEGIPKDQVEIAFMRHATSKIKNWNDLLKTLSFGFRGEALPSISSVSILELQTCFQSEKVGTTIRIEGGKQVYLGPAPPRKGCSFSVRNLFYNVPARRKFMKSESAEQRKVSQIIRRYVISRPDVGFRVGRDGRHVGIYKPTEFLVERLNDIWGSQTVKDLLKIDTEPAGPVKVGGFVSKPETTRGNRGEIYLYVNNRPVLEKAMFGAITAAYSNHISPGKFPYVALFLDIEPSFVDINVHPAKTEVRFSDEGFIFSTIKKALEKTLSVPAGIPVDVRAKRTLGKDAISFEQAKQEVFSTVFSGKKTPGLTPDHLQIDRDPTRTIIEAAEEALSFQVFDTYIIIKKEEELIIIDQHTAHERILYEKTLKAINSRKAPSQKLLFEERVKLTPDESHLVETLAEVLNRSGFEIREFGPDEVIISGMPQELSVNSPGNALKSLLSDFVEYREEGLESKKAFAAAVACRGAVKAGQRLSEPQMRGLCSDLLKCQEPFRCPHGRPTMAVLNRDDLERVFKRK
ncbi:MAG: DNA mismatch repair endonuclease MutL [Candidatus Zixiibacteriota bacterium]|nr:MAG: DNA mismatch repair endonuclease MutL [candidate division Zixibacteria bacterium]